MEENNIMSEEIMTDAIQETVESGSSIGKVVLIGATITIACGAVIYGSTVLVKKAVAAVKRRKLKEECRDQIMDNICDECDQMFEDSFDEEN